MAEKRVDPVPICLVMTGVEREALSLLERPMRTRDFIRAERIITHIARTRESLCPGVKVEEIAPEPYKTRICETLSRAVESAIKTVEERGEIEDVEAFTSLIYWTNRLKETYRCP
jgi:hypothetical protein